MNWRVLKLILSALGLLPVILWAESAEQIIAKARAYLGSESALQAVHTIHFTGALEVDARTRWPADIIFQKDYQQRITVNFEKYIETTALDHYDAWQMRFNPAEPTRWQLALLDGAQVKRLRANTLENLSFFAGLERQGVLIRVIGKVEVEGLACVSLLFSHSNNISFLRYFDQRTGRLVKTETESGGEIREVGEIIVQGVRFPGKVINKAANGQTTSIIFDRIILNEPIPASEFAVPAVPTP
ncbi:MAG: hypothetical protein RL598_1927 [Verrucomicrobiota bacterium]|jgi:hypothetical protein